MNEEHQNQDEEISLIDLFAVLWQWKIMIVGITLLAAIGVVGYSIISLRLPPEKSYKPNVYTARAWMLIENRSSGMDISSMLGSNARALTSLTGTSSLSGPTNSQLAIFLIGSNSLLDSVVDEFDIITRYKIKKYPKTSSRNRLKKQLKANYESRSGVFTVSFTNKDRVFARDVVNYCTSYLAERFDELGLDKNKIEKENLEVNIANTAQEIQLLEEESRGLEQSVASASFSGRLPAITADINRISLELTAKRQIYTQLKVQYELLKVNMASEKPIFQILEMAEVPERKSGPSRAKLCMIVTLVAGFSAVFLAFVINAIINIRNDPEAMAKLRGTNPNEKK
jgi:uncharacterized protein involved in exopolysaccharide biosynthesis